MAGLCEGDNEPPGSLKAIMLTPNTHGQPRVTSYRTGLSPLSHDIILLLLVNNQQNHRISFQTRITSRQYPPLPGPVYTDHHTRATSGPLAASALRRLLARGIHSKRGFGFLFQSWE
ncbi:hypothetical protein ANN_03830 [Periplaneta americana]|uniref:Uncharacterized protein n=1 Tax=Periplaneta americana TaxID=6978 RepID=A0ABQ8U656_PERAM|nr:hypothetical protein ANN_03830 [Periplaneta americana]